MKRGQVSFELMIIVALVLAISSVLAAQVRTTSLTAFSTAQIKSAAFALTGLCENAFVQSIEKIQVDEQYKHMRVTSIDCAMNWNQLAGIANDRLCSRPSKANLVDCGEFPKYAVTTLSKLLKDFRAPDLIPVFFYVPDSPSVGGAITVKFAVQNQGTESFRQSTAVIQLAPANPGDLPITLSVHQIPVLGQGDYYVIETELTLITRGENTLLLSVDATNQVQEENEQNNVIGVRVNVR